MKTRTRFLFPAFLLAVSILNFSCKEKESGGGKTVTPPVVVTLSPSDVAHFTATLNGEITEVGDPAYTERGVCWSPNPEPTTAGGKRSESAQGTGSFQFHCDNMAPSTLYYVRAYATTEKGTVYGQQVSFTTAPPLNTPATVTTAEATQVTASSAVLGGNVTVEGNPAHSERGVALGLYQEPMRGSVGITLPAEMPGQGSFTVTAEGLYPGSVYYARAYTTSSFGWVEYGPEVSFTTTASGTKATLTTSELLAGDNSDGGAIFRGSVVSAGSPAYTERGICYDYAPSEPNVGSFKIPVEGSGTGSFTAMADYVGYNTKIYVRSYAIGPWGVAYGDRVEFWADPHDSKPTPTTKAVNGITAVGAMGQGGISTSNEGFPVCTDYGFCYSTIQNPTLETGNVVASAAGKLEFYAPLSGLEPNTTYYVRAYATNRAGTNYGTQVSFKTLNTSDTSVPTAPQNLTAKGVTLNSVRLEWTNTATNARSIKVDKLVSGGSWQYIATMGPQNTSYTDNGLTASTTYTYRVYAANELGAGPFSESVTFLSAASAPAVTTLTPYDIKGTTATLGGNITALGSPAYNEMGVCWGKSPNPASTGTKVGVKVTNPTGGTYVTNFGNPLTPGTTYYVQAYVVSQAGTYYGEQKSFTTPAVPTAPHSLQAKLTNLTTAEVSWTIAAAGSTSYVEVSTDGGASWKTTTVILPTSASPSKATFLNLTQGTTYSYRVKSCLNEMFSGYTPTTASVATPTPPAMTAAFSRVSKGKYTLSGNITALGSPNYTERGFMWGPENKHLTDIVPVAGSGLGAFSTTATFTVGETYGVRSYVKIIGFTFYGPSLRFTAE